MRQQEVPLLDASTSPGTTIISTVRTGKSALIGVNRLG
jgi:hypothetical protein